MEAALELERFRESGLFLDKAGRFWHEGELVTHERMIRTFYRWLDRLDDGRYVLRLDDQRFVYLVVEDMPFRAESLFWEGDGAVLSLSGGALEPFDLETLGFDARGPFCAVRHGRLPVRLTTRAWQCLIEKATTLGDALVLEVNGQKRAFV